MTCEKCWADAYTRSLESGRSQADEYRTLIIERNGMGAKCSPQDQAGQFWDAERQCDTRVALATAREGE